MVNTTYTAPNLKIHLWALGAMANYWMSGVMYSFVSLVFITSYEMNPAWVATAMMLPRLIDIAIDPVLGRLSDNTHTRWGRRRPFIFVSTLLGAILVVSIWWIPLDWVHNWKGFAYLLTFSTVLYANIGVYEMAHSALGYELSDDYSQRSKVQAVRHLYFSLGSLGGGFTYWMAQRQFFGTGHAGEINGFRWLSFAMAAIILVAGMVSVITVRERFQNINRTHVSILPAIKATLRNRPFIVILVMKFINVLGSSLFGSMVAYIGIYSVCNGDKELYNKVISGWNSIAGFLLGFALVGLAAPITRWLGKRRGIIMGCGLGVIQALLLPFILQPGHVYLWFVFGLLFMPVGAVLNNMLASVMPDICDMDELEHGERREGLFTAVLSFMTKLESSLCTGLGGALLVISGFDAHLLQQPQVVLDKMRLYAFSPMIIGTILTFVAACFFTLGKKKMDEIRAQLDARHAAIHILGVKEK